MGLQSRLANKVAGLLPVKPFLARSQRGVISFTFDDFPRSALTVGGAILRRHGVAGTYYVAGGLTDGSENDLPCHHLDDITTLLRDGHELGSHGFAHVRYSSLTKADMMADLERNQRFFREALKEPGEPSVNFSYPFGDRTLTAKRLLAKHYMAARGNRPGVNGRVFDLSDLRANAIYARSMTKARLRSLIAAAEKQRGWLIFYTHDVSDSPSHYGATPELLEFAVAAAVASNCRVLPARNALGALSFS